MHWALLVVDLTKKEIVGYDSAGVSCNKNLRLMLSYLDAEHLARYHTPLPEGWEHTDTMVQQNIPRQGNGYDCGIFVCLYAYNVAMGLKMNLFDQTTIYNNKVEVRARIGLAI